MWNTLWILVGAMGFHRVPWILRGISLWKISRLFPQGISWGMKPFHSLFALIFRFPWLKRGKVFFFYGVKVVTVVAWTTSAAADYDGDDSSGRHSELFVVVQQLLMTTVVSLAGRHIVLSSRLLFNPLSPADDRCAIIWWRIGLHYGTAKQGRSVQTSAKHGPSNLRAITFPQHFARHPYRVFVRISKLEVEHN